MSHQETVEINGEPFVMTEGIFFGMDEETYHALPALGSTNLKNILISLPDFYFNSWLNPLRAEDNEDGDGSEWKRFGKASHKRILEGREEFYNQYCVEFLPPEGCLKTVDDMKAYLATTDYDMKGSSKFKKPEWTQAVKFKNPNALIFDVEAEKYARETAGRIQLSERELRRIEIAAAMIEQHPELRHCFVGGYPEVTVLWFDKGVWFKARFDYLKPRAIVDLKTFTNKLNRPIDQALYSQMAGHKYHVQAVHYASAVDRAIEFARKGMYATFQSRFSGDALVGFLQRLGEGDGTHEFFHVWQKKGGAPLARGKKFKRDLRMWAAAQASIDQATELYKEAIAIYGREIWVDTEAITDYDDDLFPAYATEI